MNRLSDPPKNMRPETALVPDRNSINLTWHWGQRYNSCECQLGPSTRGREEHEVQAGHGAAGGQAVRVLLAAASRRRARLDRSHPRRRLRGRNARRPRGGRGE